MSAASADDIARFRRQLHARPELSEREHETATAIVARLAPTHPTTVVDRLGTMQTGVCAVYDSGEPGPVVLLRAELDALPIQESNTFGHRSMSSGVSHKCGHDGHMATLVAVAEGLHAQPIRRGKVYLLFQPAEETGTGASAVLADERFKALAPPDVVYAFHNVPKYPLGQVLLRKGLFAQGSVGFIARYRGKTSHSSYPEHGVNPSTAVTELVAAVNRFDKTLSDSVSAPILGTVSYAQLGVAEKGPNFGTTPGEGVVMGVVRAHKTSDLDRVRDELASRARQLARDSGLEHELSWHEAFAATESDDDCVAAIEAAATRAGLDARYLDEPFRWSEDFGYFTAAFKGAFFGLGSGTEQPQLHDDGYDYPDALIGIGARIYRSIIDRHLAEHRSTSGKGVSR
ncbi:MAG TPA: amidohydrolase [Woeseiaceae bacterium]|nr:amidohydrolase [Woeseiaceae bacterium]